MATSRSASFPLAALVLVGIAGAPRPGHAEVDSEGPGVTYAVQNRRFRLGHELAAGVGVLPLNAFTKGVTVGGSYTYHFGDDFAWEMVQFAYALPLDTGLKNELLENFEVQPTQLRSLQYFGGSSAVWKPLYGKFAWRNRKVVHVEASLSAGGAVGLYDNPGEYLFAGSVGGGLRVHAGRTVSFRLDVRDYGFFQGFSVTHELFVALSAAFTFGG